jgi:diguanylate cyclase (GGDEF)-like protein
MNPQSVSNDPLKGDDEENEEWRDLWNGLIQIPTREKIRTFLDQKVLHTDKSKLKQKLFEVYIRNMTIPLIQMTLAAIVLLVVGTWPTDYYYFAGHPKIINAYFWWRVIGLAVMIGFLPALSYSDLIRRYIFPILYVGVLGFVALTGYLFGNVAGRNLTEPWFYAIFVIPIITVFLSVRIIPRILTTLGVPTVYGLAFLWDNFTQQYWYYEFMGMIVNIIVSVVVISILLGHIVYHLNRSNYFQARELRRQQQHIQTLADHDQLTGLYTRREFENRYHEEFERTLRYGTSLSVMMIDLDHFKEINDTYGHPVGDEVLETMGDLIRDKTRTSDVSGRYGGEEFCLVLPETPEDGAKTTAERLRQALSEETFQAEDGETFQVTCSIGIAVYDSSDDDPEELLEEADQALYEAKETGRNQVIVA